MTIVLDQEKKPRHHTPRRTGDVARTKATALGDFLAKGKKPL